MRQDYHCPFELGGNDMRSFAALILISSSVSAAHAATLCEAKQDQVLNANERARRLESNYKPDYRDTCPGAAHYEEIVSYREAAITAFKKYLEAGCHAGNAQSDKIYMDQLDSNALYAEKQAVRWVGWCEEEKRKAARERIEKNSRPSSQPALTGSTQVYVPSSGSISRFGGPSSTTTSPRGSQPTITGRQFGDTAPSGPSNPIARPAK